MLFTDIIFLVFFSTLFVLYWFPFARNLRLQNALLLSASYLFYGWWDWRFLFLIVLTSATTFGSALLADRPTCSQNMRKGLTTANIVINLLILFIFKYLNFFGDNLSRLFGAFGIELDWVTLDILLPVGISFYTFQAVSYSVDVYKKKIPATRNILNFFTYIAYFPQLVAGPIERATQLLPQISRPRTWNYQRGVEGLRMTLFGLVKKLCVADMVAIYVDRIFLHDTLPPYMVLAGGILFSIQIYCDFSAYSEIARGVSRILGIELMVNFRFPYFSRNVLDFWRRWHISLMFWLRDYVYIPLGGNRRGNRRTAINLTLVFLLSGLWHGAGWNFILWGAYWALLNVITKFLLHTQRPTTPVETRDLPAIVRTFGLVAFGFYIFRCSEAAHIMAGFTGAWAFILFFAVAWAFAKAWVRFRAVRIATVILLSCAVLAALWLIMPRWYMIMKGWWFVPALFVALTEWHDRNSETPMLTMSSSRAVRIAVYQFCLLMILLSEPTSMTFIYFQF